MKKLSLRLNERLSKIPILTDVEQVLSEYYSDKTYEDKTNYLYNTYSVFYNLINQLTLNYSIEELILIANTVYSYKGSIYSVGLLFRYLKIIYSYEYLSESNSLKLYIHKLNCKNINKSLDLIENIIKELLVLIDSSILLSVSIYYCGIQNDSKISMRTLLINNL